MNPLKRIIYRCFMSDGILAAAHKSRRIPGSLGVLLGQPHAMAGLCASLKVQIEERTLRVAATGPTRSKQIGLVIAGLALSMANLSCSKIIELLGLLSVECGRFGYPWLNNQYDV